MSEKEPSWNRTPRGHYTQKTQDGQCDKRELGEAYKCHGISSWWSESMVPLEIKNL